MKNVNKNMALNNNTSPIGWARSSFGEIAIYINGKAFKPTDWEKEGRPIIRIQNLTGSSSTINRYSKPIEEKYIVRNGDLLISWSATLDAFVYKGEDAVLNQHIFKVNPFIDKSFLYHATKAFVSDLRSKVHGSGMQHITKGKFEKTTLPLPPLPEQHRIVAKIEELFTKLDAGVDALQKIKAQLKRYRQSVLKAAFSGKLTAQWREEHRDELEPASVLLEKIKAERKEKLGSKYKELPPVDTTDLPELPEEWEWARLGVFNSMLQYGTSEKASADPSGIPVIRMGNIDEGKLFFDNLKYYPKNWSQLNKFLLEDGDVLFNRTNSAELVGKTAIFKSFHPKAVFASYLIRIKVLKNYIIPNFISHFINSFYGRQYIASVVSQQVGQANVNATKLSLMPIPFASPTEQNKIVEEIERHFSIADEIEKTIEQSLQQAERLRQSILKKAFAGKLVPQDPNDEPAEKLLQRIKQEKERLEQQKKNKTSKH